jgi:hypothetical protein
MFARTRAVAVVAVAWAAGACVGGAPPHNAIVQVTNQTVDQATFAWNTPGLFGSLVLPDTGQELISGCSTYARSFGAGLTSVNIWHGSSSIALALNPGKSDEQWHYVVIDPGGNVAEVDEASVPAEPCASP